MSKTVCGIGTNDVGRVTYISVEGKQITCIFYRVWSHMLERCYGKYFKEQNKTYIGCSVYPD